MSQLVLSLFSFFQKMPPPHYKLRDCRVRYLQGDQRGRGGVPKQREQGLFSVVLTVGQTSPDYYISEMHAQGDLGGSEGDLHHHKTQTENMQGSFPLHAWTFFSVFPPACGSCRIAPWNRRVSRARRGTNRQESSPCTSVSLPGR